MFARQFRIAKPKKVGQKWDTVLALPMASSRASVISHDSSESLMTDSVESSMPGSAHRKANSVFVFYVLPVYTPTTRRIRIEKTEAPKRTAEL